MKDLTTSINLDEEVTHLADFIRLKWEPIHGLDDIFTQIRNAALTIGRGLFTNHSVWEHADALINRRKALLTAALSPEEHCNVDYYDAVCSLLSHVRSSVRTLQSAAENLDGKWNWERHVSRLAWKLQEQYPELPRAVPQGWAALRENYQDHAGQAEYDPKPDRELFKGAKVEGVLSPSFPGQVALPYVMYSDVCQGDRAWYVLVGAALAHFLRIVEFLNTERIKQDLDTAILQLDEPRMLFEYQVQTTNPWLTVLFDTAPAPSTRAQMEESIAHRNAYNALSEEEKAKKDAEHDEDVSRIIAEVLREAKAGGSTEIDEQAELVARLNKALSA